MGASIAPEVFNREVDIALAGNPKLKNFVREVDEILLFGDSQEELEDQFKELLKVCRKSRMTRAPPGKSLQYAGMRILSWDAEMLTERAEKLALFPELTSRKELAAWIGLAAQCQAWFPEVNSSSTGMRQLLKKDIPFVWDQTHSAEFKKMKEIICSKITLSSFNPKWETKLLMDSSIKFGIAYLLLQVDPEGKVHIIRCGSCAVKKS